MKKLLILSIFSFCSLLSFLVPAAVSAQEVIPSPESSGSLLDPQPLVVRNEWFIGRVAAIESETPAEGPDGTGIMQQVRIRITRGSEEGKTVTVPNYFAGSEQTKLKVGETVIVNKTHGLRADNYYVADRYRLTPTIIVTLFFFALVIFFARWKGITAILGLIFSLLVLLRLVVPQILGGTDPLLISLAGAVLIAVISLYLAHGWNRRTSIALVSTLVTLAIAVAVALLFVWASKLYGVGSEEAFYLQLAPIGQIDLRGLLLGGIIIGALGVLDDITTAQVAAVAEIHRANDKLEFWDLYQRGITVGREHIVSLVNTLVLAYVGASFPLLLLFALNTETQPIWVTLNTELVMEEVIRTLVGSIALVFAVPIATFLTTYALKKRHVTLDSGGHSHSHPHSH